MSTSPNAAEARPALYPLSFTPIYQPKVWGGDAFARLFGRDVPAGDEPIGESWEVADLENAQSVVSEGALKGATMGELVERFGADLLGHAETFKGRFPLLIKFLDASDNLSVQVHPTQEVADEAAHEQPGGDVRVKHEAWYILESCPKRDGSPSGIYVGNKPGVTKQQLAESVESNTTPELLNFLPTTPGECYYLPSGTLHALGEGVVVAEVQTPSDITYRLYDWGRQGREMHVEQAMKCIDPADEFRKQPAEVLQREDMQITRLATCPYFTMELVELPAGFGSNERDRRRTVDYGELVIWMLLDGAIALEHPSYSGERFCFGAGQTVVLPATLGAMDLMCDEATRFIEARLPREAEPAHTVTSPLMK